MHLPTIPMWAHLAVGAAVTSWAMWKGDREARLVAGAQQLQLARMCLWPTGRGIPEDLAIWALCLWCLLRGKSYWTVLAASAALLALATHLLKAMMPDLSQWAFASAERIWVYVIWAALVWALANAGVLRSAPPRRASDAVAARSG